ncbi:uncharacterized protein METZ01_LOCUS68810 [marine metagenome]|uniref:Uncharacterized protein n=1 Tax=marine metagenome TaxID=408172 RepID=A0A381TIM3_9ZZZZ
MQKAQKRGDIPKNMNIFALMWSMKNKGDKPHYKPGVKGKLKGKYKGPEGQNEMIDPKKIRNYKNVSNAVVAKADKEAQKVKDKEQKGTLEFPEMPTEESTWSKNFKKQGAKRRGETTRRQQAQQHSPGQRVPPKTKNYGEEVDEENKAAEYLKKQAELKKKYPGKEKPMSKATYKRTNPYPTDEDMSLAPKGKGKKAAKALYKEEDIDMPSLVQQAMNKLAEGEWADEKRKERESSDRLIAIHNEREKRYQAQQAAKKKAGAKKEERDPPSAKSDVKDLLDPHRKYKDLKKSLRAEPYSGKRASREEVEMEGSLNPQQKAAREKSRGRFGIGDRKHGNSPQAAHAAGFGTGGDHQGRGVKKVRGAKEEVETEGFFSGKTKGRVTKSIFNDPAFRKITGRKSLKDIRKDHAPPKPKKEEVTHFGDVLRQAIEEAKKVNAIDTINKIVKTKTMGKLHGQKVDLFTASAIQAVYKALNKKNQEKMVSVMSKDVHGLLKMADFSMRQMKR